MLKIFSSKYNALATIGSYGKVFFKLASFLLLRFAEIWETYVLLITNQHIYYRTLTNLLNDAIYVRNKFLDKYAWVMI
jgi:hypothetical protein